MRSLLLLALFACPLASADTFNWSDPPPRSDNFTWTLPASMPCCSFSFGLYNGTIGTQDIFFSCVQASPQTCGTDFYTHFSQPIAIEISGILTFMPGTYQAPFGSTDNFGATLTIVSAPEPATVLLLLLAFALLFLFQPYRAIHKMRST